MKKIDPPVSAHFSYNEFLKSAIAANLGIDNRPTDREVYGNIWKTAEYLLEPIRVVLGSPIQITSGFRCEELNNAVGGAKNSQHMRGLAADITAGGAKDNIELFEKIIKSGRVPFDQLILEDGAAWIHVSYAGARNRGQVIDKTR